LGVLLAVSLIISQVARKANILMYMFSVYVCQCIYNEWKGFLGWTSELRAIFGRSLKEQETTLLRTVNSFNLPIFFPWVILWILLLLDCSVD
jgi:hypothetical protein